MNVAVGLTPDWAQWEGETVDGAFPLEQFLGCGPKSAVFRTHTASGSAAIKLVPARPEDVQSLVNRWKRASSVGHPHLLRILKTGTWKRGGTSLAYLVTEYGEENLGAVLAERALTVDEVREMLPPIAEAVAYLHGRGLTLGNLKPANVLAVDDMLKLASDSIASGDPSGDLRGFAATVTQALTQRADAVDRVPEPFRDIARHCMGSNGRPAWTAAELVSRLQSRGPAAEPARAKSTGPRPTTYAIATALVLVALIVVGAYLKNRGGEKAAQAPVTQAPAAQNPAPVPAKAAQTPVPVPAKTTQPAPEPVAPKPAARERSPQPAPVQASTGSDQAVQQPLPEITDKARRTIHGTVVIHVKVTIDETGSVTAATLQPTASRYLGKLCAAAAREWRFLPAEGGGTRERTLRFQITQADTRASVVPAR